MRATRMIGTVLVAVVLLLGVAIQPASGADTAAAGLPAAPTWRQVSAGDAHTCGITSEHRLYCWGSDAAGQLGDGGTNTDQPTPVEVTGGRTDWASVSAGGVSTCARTTAGQLFCWGSDFYGQLGNGGANTDVGEPTAVAGGNRVWKVVSVGVEHACARSRAGRLFCWGRDGSGQLGDDAELVNQGVPTEVAGGGTDWTQVAAGMFHTCALRSTGHLYCFGADGAGQLGDGDPLVDQGTPVEVSGGASNWVQVAVGASHTCALKSVGRLYCWGWDHHGQRGDGDPATDDLAGAPVRVAEGSTRWQGVSAAGWHTCARTVGVRGGTVYCWGLDEDGEVGDGEPRANQPAPVAIVGGGKYRQLDAGQYHNCAIRATDRLFCWGDGGAGRIGNGEPGVDQPSPVEVPVPV